MKTLVLGSESQADHQKNGSLLHGTYQERGGLFAVKTLVLGSESHVKLLSRLRSPRSARAALVYRRAEFRLAFRIPARRPALAGGGPGQGNLNSIALRVAFELGKKGTKWPK